MVVIGLKIINDDDNDNYGVGDGDDDYWVDDNDDDGSDDDNS